MDTKDLDIMIGRCIIEQDKEIMAKAVVRCSAYREAIENLKPMKGESGQK